jgi:hypothetical protein
VGIAVDDPVDDASTSDALDRANAERDLARLSESSCAPAASPPPPEVVH